jgi:spore maturation protein CgeB
MKILNHVNYVGGLGADRWIGSGLRDAFEELGHQFYWLTSAENFGARLDEVLPDILLASQSQLNPKNLAAITVHRKRGMRVVMRVDSFFDRDPIVKEILTKEDPADIYYGEVEPPHMDHFEKVTGKKYVVIANAAHHKLHFPGKFSKKYECDIVFLGAWLPKKKEAFEKILFPLRKKYKVRLYGPGWTMKDNFLRGAGLLSRKLGLDALNRFISDVRMTVPAEEERDLYTSAKICLNLHERGPEANVLLNERTFKIPACGGFEICDFVPPLRRYFTEKEVVMAVPPAGWSETVGADDNVSEWADDWFDKIDYYLKHDAERKKIQEAGTKRALRDHTYKNRVEQMFKLLGI